MTPLQEIISKFQELVAQVPEIFQPFIVMLAGAVPFVEGEVAALIGLLGGLNPVVAGVVAAAGNFISVLLVVLLTSRARTAVVTRNRVRVGATVGAAAPAGHPEAESAFEETAPAKPLSKGRQRLNTWIVRFGVPGASILGPFAIPTQLTSAILVAGGTSRAWVLLWQAVAIVLWTTISTVSIWAALTYLVGA
ncbi:small multidrug efflux protein [Cellulomonas chengniuliangii]|uniref:Small multidrug efflux protein n=1 Tax=Cellulomonas chengniuliangii TaxID=2968084 RepID=A0ABY5KYK1_9CELL|nr:small multidrug efflux protein [Cellulomonas chengniuliangii]MCC2307650.1 small multidrug efflux protein [Cellulomonas chengniuliangii]UUI75586.1 small multidrug efflux protein [Cellulomonas chengniuliangii]